MKFQYNFNLNLLNSRCGCFSEMMAGQLEWVCEAHGRTKATILSNVDNSSETVVINIDSLESPKGLKDEKVDIELSGVPDKLIERELPEVNLVPSSQPEPKKQEYVPQEGIEYTKIPVGFDPSKINIKMDPNDPLSK